MKDAESEIVFSRDKPPPSVPTFFTPAFFRDYCLTLPIKFAKNKSLFLWRTCWNTNESVLALESWQSTIARTVFTMESSHFSPKLLIWNLSWMSFPKLSSYFGLMGLKLFFNALESWLTRNAWIGSNKDLNRLSNSWFSMTTTWLPL